MKIRKKHHMYTYARMILCKSLTCIVVTGMFYE